MSRASHDNGYKLNVCVSDFEVMPAINQWIIVVSCGMVRLSVATAGVDKESERIN